jgi:hypothetical protein
LTIAAAIAATLAAPSAQAGGGPMTGGASELTQLMNNGELMSIVSQEAATYGVELEQYIVQYQQLMNAYQNVQGMANGAQQMQAYSRQIDKLSAAKAVLAGLSQASGRHAELLRADIQTMQQWGLSPREYAARIAVGARQGHEASRQHFEEVAASHEDLQAKSQAVKELHLENLSCDGNVKCLQGIATQNAQLANVMIEMSGDIKQLLSIQLKRDVDNKADIAAQLANDYGNAKADERAALRQTLIKN